MAQTRKEEEESSPSKNFVEEEEPTLAPLWPLMCCLADGIHAPMDNQKKTLLKIRTQPS